MVNNELELLHDHMDEMNEIMVERWKGKTISEIATTLKKPRQRVKEIIEEWATVASRNDVIRSRAREALSTADAHYSKLIGHTYEVMEEADSNNNLTAKTNAIKLIADMEARRIDMLQKSGLLENKELAEEMIETQRRQKALESILKDVVAECPRCRPEVLSRLSEVSRPDEAVVVPYVHVEQVDDEH
jgi:uncharacterized protein with PIN domain